MTIYLINEYKERTSAMFHVLSITTCCTRSPISPLYHVCLELRVLGVGIGCFVTKENPDHEA